MSPDWPTYFCASIRKSLSNPSTLPWPRMVCPNASSSERLWLTPAMASARPDAASTPFVRVKSREDAAECAGLQKEKSLAVGNQVPGLVNVTRIVPRGQQPDQGDDGAAVVAQAVEQQHQVLVAGKQRVG